MVCSKRWNAFGMLLVIVALVALSVPAGVHPVAAQDGEPVTTVNGEPVTRADFHARLQLVRWQYLYELNTLYELTGGNFSLLPTYVTTLADSLDDPVQLGDDVLYQIEQERILWQTGEELGLLPSAEAVQAQENLFFSMWTDVPVENLAQDAGAQAFITEWYAGASAASGMTQDEIRVLFELEALNENLYTYLSSNVPAEEESAHTRHILCAFNPDNLASFEPPTGEQRANAENCAQTALIRLANGENFEAVAMALSDDLASAQSGGDVGWELLSNLVEPYAEAVRSAELNTVIGPVETVFGLHVIEVLERELQQLSEEEYEASKQGYFTLWTNALHDEAVVERSGDWNANLPVDPGLDTLDAEVLSEIQAVREETAS